MNDVERTHREIVNEHFSKSRCKNCPYYCATKIPTVNFCNLIYPNPHDCNLLAEELGLKGHSNDCKTNS